MRLQDDIVGDLEVLRQDVQHACGHRAVDLQQGDRAVTKLLEAPVDRFKEVVGFVLLDGEVRVADDAEQVGALDLRTRKQLLDVCVDDVLEKYERAPRRLADSLRDRDEARQHVRHFHAGELCAVAMADDDREVLAEVRDQWERMAWIERQRRQDRADIAREVRAEELTNLRGPRVGLEKLDVLGREQPAQLVPACGLILELLPGPRPHGVELLLGVVAIGRDVLDPFAQRLEHRRDADHEELVEVGADNREELHPLEKRMRGVGRLGQHALIELEPAQLAVDVERRILEIGRVDLGIDCTRCNDAQDWLCACGGWCASFVALPAFGGCIFAGRIHINESAGKGGRGS